MTSTIIGDSKVVFAEAFGSADLENRVPATTAIRTGSLAKPLTAAAAMKFAADGKLDLDAPVQGYCPAFPEKQWPVTTRQLLGNLGGVRHYKADYSDFLSTKHYATLNDSFEQFAAEPLVVERGRGISTRATDIRLLVAWLRVGPARASRWRWRRRCLSRQESRLQGWMKSPRSSPAAVVSIRWRRVVSSKTRRSSIRAIISRGRTCFYG